MDRRAKAGRANPAGEIRRAAETRLERDAHGGAPDNGGRESDPVVHELRVHQIELELQNDELRRARGELEEARDRYASLYDRAPFGYLTLVSNGVIVQANLTAAALFGIERGRLVGRAFTSFMSEVDAGLFHLHRRSVFTGEGARRGCNLDLRRADGSLIHAHLDSVMDTESMDGAAPRPRMHTVIVDVTELRVAQLALQRSEARFRQIADHVDDAFYFREPSGAISYISPAYEQIWGRSAAALAGKTDAWLDTVEEDDRARAKQTWAHMRGGAPISEVYRIRRPDGTLRWVHNRAFPIETDDGAVVGNVGVVRDVTNERKLQDALRQAEKMEAVGTLAGGVAHNLRNVLQAAIGFVRLAERRGTDDPRSGPTLERAVGVMLKGAVLIEQLMIFARKQDAELPLRPFDVDQAIRDATSLLTTVVGVQIQLDIDTRAPGRVVMADPVQIEQILLNLATNARDAMHGAGRLAISTAAAVLDDSAAEAQGVAPGPHVIITVEDSGSGMDAATKARIFEPFFTTKEIGKGTGLGLSTVFALVRQFGGCIEVDSEVGRGTKFTICLPSRESQLPEMSAAT
jgi:PAS domain S-box-containing protein